MELVRWEGVFMVGVTDVAVVMRPESGRSARMAGAGRMGRMEFIGFGGNEGSALRTIGVEPGGYSDQFWLNVFRVKTCLHSREDGRCGGRATGEQAKSAHGGGWADGENGVHWVLGGNAVGAIRTIGALPGAYSDQFWLNVFPVKT